MTSKLRGWNSRMHLQATTVALAASLLFVLGVVAMPTARVQTLVVLHTFTAGAEGASPHAGLIPDAAGNLFGTTVSGGTYGYGSVFKLDTAGNATVLHSFTGGADGSGPHAGLVLDAAGNLYGTTANGGTYSYGVVFQLDTTGTETVLYTFTGGADGANPYAGLLRDASGNLYGTTYYGGADNKGVVFKLDPTGKETVLYSFTGASDGAHPYAGLIQDAAGNLYGTTYNGGSSNKGVVFKLGTTGIETVLHSFTGPPDGANPSAGLIRDTAGNLYGATYYGGSSDKGVVFKLDPTGRETVLYSFTGGSDGAHPYAGLIQDAAGNLYGTTYGGGSGYGVVFKLGTTGTETVLHSFSGGAVGAFPHAGLIQDAAGNLYGTTYGGGSGYGTVFKIFPGLATHASVSPGLLTFGSQRMGASSAAQSATLTNTGTVGITINSVVASANYAQTNNCGSSLAAGVSCQISVTFTPTATGPLAGTVTIYDTASNSPQTIRLTGAENATKSPQTASLRVRSTITIHS
jgi:uncharacterized repeat protein (TIGR03803 family)